MAAGTGSVVRSEMERRAEGEDGWRWRMAEAVEVNWRWMVSGRAEEGEGEGGTLAEVREGVQRDGRVCGG